MNYSSSIHIHHELRLKPFPIISHDSGFESTDRQLLKWTVEQDWIPATPGISQCVITPSPVNY